MTSTTRTCLPQGQALLEVGCILAAQSAAERSGAALDGRLAAAVAGADLSSILPAALTPGGGGRRGGSGGGGRWTGVRRGGPHRSGGGGGDSSGGHEGVAPGSAGGSSSLKKRSSRLKPVAFVSVGAIDPDSSAVQLSRPAAEALAVAAATAAAGHGYDQSQGQSSDSELPVPPGLANLSCGATSGEEGGAGVGVGAADEPMEAALQLLQVVEDLGGGDSEVEVDVAVIPADGAAAVAAGGLAGRFRLVQRQRLQQPLPEEAAAAAEEVDGGAEADGEAEQRGDLGTSRALYTRWGCAWAGLRAAGGRAGGRAGRRVLSPQGRLLFAFTCAWHVTQLLDPS